MLKAPWMMKLLKSRNLEVIQMSKVVWRKEGFDLSIILILFFLGEEMTVDVVDRDDDDVTRIFEILFFLPPSPSLARYKFVESK